MPTACPSCGHQFRIELPADCRFLRQSAGLSLQQVADHLGYSKGYLGGAELRTVLVAPDFPDRYRAAVRELQPTAEAKAA